MGYAALPVGMARLSVCVCVCDSVKQQRHLTHNNADANPSSSSSSSVSTHSCTQFEKKKTADKPQHPLKTLILIPTLLSATHSGRDNIPRPFLLNILVISFTQTFIVLAGTPLSSLNIKEQQGRVNLSMRDRALLQTKQSASCVSPITRSLSQEKMFKKIK